MGLREIPPEAAYATFLSDLSVAAKEWLYLVNKGSPPYHRYRNPYLDSGRLGVGRGRAISLAARAIYGNVLGGVLGKMIGPVGWVVRRI